MPEQILADLARRGSAATRQTKARFAIAPEPSHGIFLKDLQVYAKQIGRDDALALRLFDTGVYEAKLLCRMLFNPAHITEALMEKWVAAFDNWEICDTYCMGFMGKSPFAVSKAYTWVEREPEYQKRAGFVLMVSHAFTHKTAPNDEFRQFFPVLVRHVSDERTYVMKGVNWALRQIGKRNRDLYQEALAVADEILALNTPSARWIAKDAIRQLKAPNVAMKHYPAKLYRD
jgi:3-methyladenine DNA glycosylase AlkD